ncbi:hypothetical protein BKA70DRAFT_1225358 [Coprinopsis sp. MPI-PUGE-AT-0042]|nr:hypothetical protein BKA70DRAFT_1225358 [Coprinopsis sp. MPI-PUGE-AT-0042]
MMRWQEEYEQKLVEFVRAIRHYETMAAVWKSLSEASGNVEHTGKVNYARKTAARYRDQASRCSTIFSEQAGYPDLTDEAKVLEYATRSRQELRSLRDTAFMSTPNPCHRQQTFETSHLKLDMVQILSKVDLLTLGRTAKPGPDRRFESSSLATHSATGYSFLAQIEQ